MKNKMQQVGNVAAWQYVQRWMNVHKALISEKTISEPQTRIEPTTFW